MAKSTKKSNPSAKRTSNPSPKKPSNPPRKFIPESSGVIPAVIGGAVGGGSCFILRQYFPDDTIPWVDTVVPQPYSRYNVLVPWGMSALSLVLG
ncbi:unnamed protein product, partial [marine sediment metagenome]